MSEAPNTEAEATPEVAPETTSLLNATPAEGETVTLADGEWLYGAEIKGVGDKPDWFKSEKYKTVEAQAEAYTALESKFGGFTGAPDEYALNLPEGFEGEFDNDDPLLVAGREFAKDSNMNQESFDKMVGLWMSNTVESPEEAQAAQAAQLVDVLGEGHAQVISQVSGALSNLLDADTFKRIAPYANTPESIALVQAVILATAPKVSPINGGANPDGFTKSGLQDMRSQVIESGPQKGRLRHHVDPEFRKQIERYSIGLHGDG